MKKTLKMAAKLIWFDMVIGAAATELIINIKRFLDYVKEVG